jgi:hypothetical protein
MFLLSSTQETYDQSRPSETAGVQGLPGWCSTLATILLGFVKRLPHVNLASRSQGLRLAFLEAETKSLRSIFTGVVSNGFCDDISDIA